PVDPIRDLRSWSVSAPPWLCLAPAGMGAGALDAERHVVRSKEPGHVAGGRTVWRHWPQTPVPPGPGSCGRATRRSATTTPARNPDLATAWEVAGMGAGDAATVEHLATGHRGSCDLHTISEDSRRSWSAGRGVANPLRRCRSNAAASAPATQGPQPGGELGDGEGLLETVVGTGVEAVDSFRQAVGGGEEEDRRPAGPDPQGAAHLDAVSRAEGPVDDNDVVGPLRRHQEHVDAVVDVIDGVTVS